MRNSTNVIAKVVLERKYNSGDWEGVDLGSTNNAAGYFVFSPSLPANAFGVNSRVSLYIRLNNTSTTLGQAEFSLALMARLAS
jgi:hypothetical protein